MTSYYPPAAQNPYIPPQLGAEPGLPPVGHLRHWAEIPMLVIGGFGVVMLILLSALVLIVEHDLPSLFVYGLIGTFLAPVLIALFLIRYAYWQIASNGVEVTERQLPDLYRTYAELGARLGMHPQGRGMDQLPRLYVLNGNGVMNAFATKCQIWKTYVVIYSDLLDLAYLNNNADAVRFVLAHELGHVKCRHVSIWRIMLQPAAQFLLLDKSIIRAKEYTADRVASYLVPHAATTFISVIAGKHMSNHINLDAYFESVARHKNGFWLRLVNFRSDHAVGFRRMQALNRVASEGWNVHGKML